MFPVLSNLRRFILKWMRWCYLNFIRKAFGKVSALNIYLRVYFRLSEPHRYFSVAPETLLIRNIVVTETAKRLNIFRFAHWRIQGWGGLDPRF